MTFILCSLQISGYSDSYLSLKPFKSQQKFSSGKGERCALGPLFFHSLLTPSADTKPGVSDSYLAAALQVN